MDVGFDAVGDRSERMRANSEKKLRNIFTRHNTNISHLDEALVPFALPSVILMMALSSLSISAVSCCSAPPAVERTSFAQLSL